MAPTFDRLPSDQEIAIFRVVQECLTNIHRHSDSQKAAIQIARRDGWVYVSIRDEGKGMPPEKQLALNSSGLLGVGLRGMRERMRQLGGTLEVQSNGKGTTVTAAVPCAASTPTTAHTPSLHEQERSATELTRNTTTKTAAG
jgi:signal transduction histidine kinase